MEKNSTDASAPSARFSISGGLMPNVNKRKTIMQSWQSSNHFKTKRFGGQFVNNYFFTYWSLCRDKTISVWGQMCLIAFQPIIKKKSIQLYNNMQLNKEHIIQNSTPPKMNEKIHDKHRKSSKLPWHHNIKQSVCLFFSSFHQDITLIKCLIL